MTTAKRNCDIQTLLKNLDYLKECLSYDPDTGDFTWKYRPLTHFRNRMGWNVFNTKYAGKRAGTYPDADCPFPYVLIGVTIGNKKCQFTAHTLAWAFSGREFEEGKVVDHQDQIGTNNRLSNLRLGTTQQNAFNTGTGPNNTSGHKGVQKVGRRWQSKIVVNRKTIHLGMFDTFDEAVIARQKYETEHFGEFSPHYNSAGLTPEEEKWVNSIGNI